MSVIELFWTAKKGKPYQHLQSFVGRECCELAFWHQPLYSQSPTEKDNPTNLFQRAILTTLAILAQCIIDNRQIVNGNAGSKQSETNVENNQIDTLWNICSG